MKQPVIMIVLLIAFVAGFIVWYNLKPTPIPTSQSASTEQAGKSNTDEQANVTVTVTPSDISTNGTEWKFNVIMDTHSVELNHDMLRVSVLYDDQGNAYNPTRWEGTTGGHHREGTLIFTPITPAPTSIELKITGIADTVRTFTWQIDETATD